MGARCEIDVGRTVCRPWRPAWLSKFAVLGRSFRASKTAPRHAYGQQTSRFVRPAVRHVQSRSVPSENDLKARRHWHLSPLQRSGLWLPHRRVQFPLQHAQAERYRARRNRPAWRYRQAPDLWAVYSSHRLIAQAQATRWGAPEKMDKKIRGLAAAWPPFPDCRNAPGGWALCMNHATLSQRE